MKDKIAEIDQLSQIAFNARIECLKMAANGGCFLGASLSCVDLLAFLYGRFLNISPDIVTDKKRDYLFLSKGHDVPALYAVLVEYGFLDRQRLNNHLNKNDFIYWHPNTKINGIEFHSGSLGHLPSVSLGYAYDLKLRKSKSKVLTIVGDGELNEGTVWEALLTANSLKLNNFIIIVDRNQFQANGPTEEIIPLEPLVDKFKSFNCEVFSVDGHSFEDLERTFNDIKDENFTTKVVICNTTRGKGIPSIEAKADKWFLKLEENMYFKLLEELNTGRKSGVELPSTCVR